MDYVNVKRSWRCDRVGHRCYVSDLQSGDRRRFGQRNDLELLQPQVCSYDHALHFGVAVIAILEDYVSSNGRSIRPKTDIHAKDLIRAQASKNRSRTQTRGKLKEC